MRGSVIHPVYAEREKEAHTCQSHAAWRPFWARKDAKGPQVEAEYLKEDETSNGSKIGSFTTLNFHYEIIKFIEAAALIIK